MSAHTFERATAIPCSAEALFAYHARRGALTRLTPPFTRVRNAVEIDALANGAVATLEIGVGPLWRRVVAVHDDVTTSGSVLGFVDTMGEGPFHAWRHEHRFEKIDDGHAQLVDRITFEMPAGQGLGAGYVEKQLARTFAHRHATTRLDAALFAATTKRPLVVGVTGASGLIGTELCALLSVAGHSVVRFARRAGPLPPGRDDVAHWDPASGAVVVPRALDVVVHLAGEAVAAGRLDGAHAARVKDSRVDATRLLVAALAKLGKPPAAFVSASAVGWYGDRGDDVIDDDAPPGHGVLADICAGWQDAALGASALGMRACALRVGVVLSPAGGALAKMLPAFRAGAGAKIASGAQWMALLSIDDVGAMFFRAVVDERMQGAVNAVGPEPLTNAAFTDVLAHVLHRPAFLTVPKVAARAMFGTAFADEALFASQRVVPSRLTSLGHAFRHADVASALRHVLGCEG